MNELLFKWLRKNYNKFLHSIAFLPAIMGLLFLLMGIGLLELDKTGYGDILSRSVEWLSLKDASSARTIVATVAAGIISLTVFSFSMVMIVMNQAASQMSNRMLDNIIGDRLQKYVLGFYVGTIVMSLLLLTSIRESGNTSNVPQLSIYVLLVFAVFDIFLFIYFLHHITQSFRYEQLIQRIHDRTSRTLARSRRAEHVEPEDMGDDKDLVLSMESGYFQGFDEDRLLKLLELHDLQVGFLYPAGTYILKGTPLLKLKGNRTREQEKEILEGLDFYYGQEIDKNPYYGFFHLTEVALKGLSPSLNDPGTAALAINALTDLLSDIMKAPLSNHIRGEKGNIRIFVRQYAFIELFKLAMLPIWDYGKNDRIFRKAVENMLNQLLFLSPGKKDQDFLEEIRSEFQLSEH